VLPFGRLWYDTPNNAIGDARHSSRSHDAVIRVYDDAGNVIETHEAQGRVQRAVTVLLIVQNGLRLRFVQFELCVHFLQRKNNWHENNFEPPTNKLPLPALRGHSQTNVKLFRFDPALAPPSCKGTYQEEHFLAMTRSRGGELHR
jgi:hypothetical protein